MPKQKELHDTVKEGSASKELVLAVDDPGLFFCGSDGEIKPLPMLDVTTLDGHSYWRHKEKDTTYKIICVGNGTATKKEPGSDFEHTYVSYREVFSTDVYTTTETAFRQRMEPNQ